MIKKGLVFVTILTVLTMHVGTVFAAPLSAGEVVELESAHGGASGTVFIFKVNGEFSGAELQGNVQTGDGAEFPLYCAQLNAETVRCLTSSKVWGDVTVTFGGKSFATHVGPFERAFTSTSGPSEPTDPIDPTGPTEPTEYCYDIYDYPDPGYTVGVWTDVGDRCQSSAATVGQQINFFNPSWNDTYTYQFMLNSSGGCDYDYNFPDIDDDAFYYVCGGE